MQMIDKEELLELLGDAEQDAILDDECEAETIKKCVRLVKSMKAAEVVRCKDCKQYYETPDRGNCRWWNRPIQEEDFCSYGERKDNGK